MSLDVLLRVKDKNTLKMSNSNDGGREVDLSVLPLQDLLKIQTQFQEVRIKGGKKKLITFYFITFGNFSHVTFLAY